MEIKKAASEAAKKLAPRTSKRAAK